jgi:hypothetical protein
VTLVTPNSCTVRGKKRGNNGNTANNTLSFRGRLWYHRKKGEKREPQNQEDAQSVSNWTTPWSSPIIVVIFIIATNTRK